MEKFGFFNSNGGDRIYDAGDFAQYFGNLVSNGIFYISADNLQVQTATGMTVKIKAGAAFINGYNYQNTTDLELPIATANGVNPRIDRAVLRLDMTARSINLAIKTGVPSGTPTAPDLTRNDNIYELGLADIFVPQGAISINSNDISDTRLNQNLCGLVNSLVSSIYE